MLEHLIGLHADPNEATCVGQLEGTLHTKGLTTLQLAAQLGARDMFKHILRKQVGCCVLACLSCPALPCPLLCP